MRCSRCDGLMRQERIHWRRNQTWFCCMSCGDRVDHTILQHRRPVRRTVAQPGAWEKIQDLVAQKEISAC